MEHQELLSRFIRWHVLHHAAEREPYGRWMIEELARHGYTLSPGTLHPVLRAMERRGYLVSEERRVGRALRRIDRVTPMGLDALAMARDKARELFGEIMIERGLPAAEPDDERA